MVAALLAVPRATKPGAVPQPVVHRRALDVTLSQLARRAESARTQPLPFAVREVGEAYRRLGRTQYEGPQPLDDSQALGWQQLVRAARGRSGDANLLTLRAVQAQLLVSAFERWETTGEVSDDLAELGGDFVRLAQQNHWWFSHQLKVSYDERWALALLRWTSLAGFTQLAPYRLDRELEIVELRFFFRHLTQDASQFRICQRIVQRYAELDPSYPVDYARGVLFAEAGQYDPAAAHFTRHLQNHPQGDWAIRARNHLIWVTQQLHNHEDDDVSR
jgi:hypothetical protein